MKRSEPILPYVFFSALALSVICFFLARPASPPEWTAEQKAAEGSRMIEQYGNAATEGNPEARKKYLRAMELTGATPEEIREQKRHWETLDAIKPAQPKPITTEVRAIREAEDKALADRIEQARADHAAKVKHQAALRRAQLELETAKIEANRSLSPSEKLDAIRAINSAQN